MISLFMTFSASTGEWRIHPDEVAAVAELVGSIPDMTEGLLFTPLEKSVDHPYKADGSGPVFALQLRFPDLFACEAAMDRSGILASLATGARIVRPHRTGCHATGDADALLSRRCRGASGRHHRPVQVPRPLSRPGGGHERLKPALSGAPRSPTSEQSPHHAANQSAGTAPAVLMVSTRATTGWTVVIGFVAAAEADMRRRGGFGQERLMLQRI